MSVFSTVVCPRCAPGIGGGGHNANLGFVPELQNRVGPYDCHSLLHIVKLLMKNTTHLLKMCQIFDRWYSSNRERIAEVQTW